MASVPAKDIDHISANHDQADRQPTRRRTLSSAPKVHVALEQNVITSGRDTHIHIVTTELSQHGEAKNLSIEAMRKVADWLSPLNYHQIQNDIFERVTPGTAKWILEHSAFIEWRAGRIKTLWAGAGKSCLTSFIVDHLVNQEHATVIYIYCQYKDQLSSADILACLLKQLVETSDQVASYISESLYRKGFQMDTKPTRSQLVQALAGAVSKASNLILVVDALDELKEEVYSGLIPDLISLQIPLLLTSRPHVSLDNIESNLSIQAPDQDIHTFIWSCLSCMPRLQPFFKDLRTKEEIVEELCKKCHGIFLLAALQLDIVAFAGIINIPTLRAAINKLPTTLNDQYQLMLSRIQEQSQLERELAFQAILLVIQATESLQVEVLLEALTVNISTGCLDKESHTTVETLTRVSMGFLSLTQSNKSMSGRDELVETENIATIQLIHHSAQTFLQEQPDFLAEKSHTTLADTSAIYLLCTKLELHKITTISGLENGDITAEYPFLSYASMNIGYHTCKAIENTQGILPAYVTQLLQKQGSMPLPLSLLGDYLDHAQAIHFAAFYGLEILPMQTPLSTGNRSVLGCSPLFYACLGGHATLANKITKSLQACIAIGYPTTFGATVLHAACTSGNLDIIQLLLPMIVQEKSSWGYTGIPILARMQDGQTAFYLAAENGHTDTVKGLLAHLVCIEKKRSGITSEIHKASSEIINAKTNTNTTPLYIATKNGHTAIIQLLLNSLQIQINAKNDKEWTPLHIGAYKGHQGVVELLLASSGIDINAREEDQWTPLHLAAQNSHQAVVQLLLASPGIDINAREENQFTPLHLAVQDGHEAVIQLLLASPGMDIHARTGIQFTPLHIAAQNGHQAVVQQLLACPGIDINAREHLEFTPLHVAAQNGHQAVAQLLLATPGIDINARTARLFTPLHLGVQNGHQTVVQLLLASLGIDIHARTEKQFTPLHLAAQNGHQAVVQLLLASTGIDINARTADQFTPLHVAAENGHQAVVQLLLASSKVDSNAREHLEWTPLHLAAQNGHQAVVQLLLAFTGININARTADQFTPLHIAAQNGHQAVVQLLLASTGIDINARTAGQSTPLHVVAQHGHEAVVHLLLGSLGIDINARTERQFTPLHIAAQDGHEAVVHLLLTSTGIDINARTERQFTPLHLGIQNSHRAVVQLLLASTGIDINARTERQFTPLHIAAQDGHEAIAQLLLASTGIDINARMAEQFTPLHLAAQNGHEAIVQLLLASPAVDINARTAAQHTPLHIVAFKGHQVIVQLLLDTPGIEINVQDKDGDTEVDNAVSSGHEDIAQLLRSYGCKGTAAEEKVEDKSTEDSSNQLQSEHDGDGVEKDEHPVEVAKEGDKDGGETDLQSSQQD